jgi:hypothetical protein
MAESILTIVFRGLVVFHKTVGPPSLFEIGLLPTSHHDNPPHIPRIITCKNNEQCSVMPIGGLHPESRHWRLNVEGPLGDGVSTDEQGAFNRASHTYQEDYRWLIDLEDNIEFFGPLAGKFDTSRLKPVLQIPNGRFYTRLLSYEMMRRKDNEPEMVFGKVSAAVGCDIRLTGSKAELVVAGTCKTIFTFNADPTGSTHYEIANTPPDTHVPVYGEDHFQHYYDLFTVRVPKFKFRPPPPPPGQPAPSPALCGEVRLGQMRHNL